MAAESLDKEKQRITSPRQQLSPQGVSSGSLGKLLRTLLSGLFTINEARLFISDYSEEICQLVHWDTNAESVFFDLTKSLLRYGIDNTFFDSLIEQRINRRAFIEHARKRWQRWERRMSKTLSSGCSSGSYPILPSPGPTNIVARGSRPFIGRTNELSQIQNVLSTERDLVAIIGPSGTGKSELALRYAEACSDLYPGGRFLVTIHSKAAPPELAQLGHAYLDVPVKSISSLDTDCKTTLARLGAEKRTLLVYDNTPDLNAVAPWIPPSRNCDCIITSTSRFWAHYDTVLLEPLNDQDAHRLLSACGIPLHEESLREQIISEGGGLPAHLYPESIAAANQLKLGCSTQPAPISRQQRCSFDRAWSLLTDDAKLYLRIVTMFETRSAPKQRIHELLQLLDWDRPRTTRAFMEASGQFMIDEKLRIHDLATQYIRDIQQLQYPDIIVAEYVHDLVSVAQTYFRKPNVEQYAIELSYYPWRDAQWLLKAFPVAQYADILAVAMWRAGHFEAMHRFALANVDHVSQSEVQGPVNYVRLGEAEHRVGLGYRSVGNEEEAIKWFKRAVGHKRLGDHSGDVNPDSIGRSEYELARCYARKGHYSASNIWFERAIANSKTGDVQGRVHHHRTGMALHQLGCSLLILKRHDEALDCFRRALEEKHKGDANRTTDRQSIGKTLHQIACCYLDMNRPAEARPWFQKAVKEKEQGNTHGVVNHDSLGSTFHQLGDCYADLGNYDKAVECVRTAIEHKRRGDKHGRVDNVSIAECMHSIGACHAENEAFVKGFLWYRRAIRYHQLGDQYHRIDHESLGASMHQVAWCSLQHEAIDSAMLWFEHAVHHRKKGDSEGVIDHVAVARSAYALASCYEQAKQLKRAERFKQALAWYQFAVSHLKGGDRHGRVDHGLVGVNYYAIGRCNMKLKRYHEAQSLLCLAFHQLQREGAKDKVDPRLMGEFYHDMGHCYTKLNEPARAIPFLQEALKEIARPSEFSQNDRKQLIETLHRLATAYLLTDNPVAAQRAQMRGLAERDKLAPLVPTKGIRGTAPGIGPRPLLTPSIFIERARNKPCAPTASNKVARRSRRVIRGMRVRSRRASCAPSR